MHETAKTRTLSIASFEYRDVGTCCVLRLVRVRLEGGQQQNAANGKKSPQSGTSRARLAAGALAVVVTTLVAAMAYAPLWISILVVVVRVVLMAVALVWEGRPFSRKATIRKIRTALRKYTHSGMCASAQERWG